ncbi:hypothetical protein mRhiFer1_008305 [Rhinolophus ferrumequinum]|uniref:Uncharacterized protein n=1 Tax=Rhinolophus ferrumequinum TaxID=59479 RepID=A0A7J7VR24_RHIFE|nr:hypothetical protein mRhiFer1_008305 [Rhinolophus ferrumequinum]
MVVHSPLVLVLPRAAWDRCSPMVCILFFNLENSIGQEEEVWDLGVGVLALPMAFICLLCRSAVCVGVMGTHALAGPAKGAPARATQNLCLGVGCCQQAGPGGRGSERRQSLPGEDQGPSPDCWSKLCPPLPTQRPDSCASLLCLG